MRPVVLDANYRPMLNTAKILDNRIMCTPVLAVERMPAPTQSKKQNGCGPEQQSTRRRNMPIRFNRRWPKLNRKVGETFTTIRLDKGTQYWDRHIRKTLAVVVEGELFGRAKLLYVDRLRLSDLTIHIAMDDAGMTLTQLRDTLKGMYDCSDRWDGINRWDGWKTKFVLLTFQWKHKEVAPAIVGKNERLR